MHAKHSNKTGTAVSYTSTGFIFFFSTIVDAAATGGGVYFSLKLQRKQTLVASWKIQDQALISFYNSLIKPLI